MQHIDNQTIQLILIAVVVVAMLFQSIILIALFVTMRKTVRSAGEQIQSIHSSVVPLIDNSRALLDRLTPKIEKTSDDLAALAHSLRIQTDDLQAAANEIIVRIRGQANRFDALITDLLDGVDRASNFMSDAVSKPMRQFSAILASIKAAVESLRSVEHGPHAQPVKSGDNDMFV
jgi:ABC-type transporter Mla subunit MlaD